MQRIGILGATFNPPTLGHYNVISQALPHFDTILLVPNLVHAFHKPLAPIHYRLEMLSLFLDYWKNPVDRNKIQISNVEALIQQQQNPTDPIYTFDVLSRLSEEYKAHQQPFEMRFIVGPDNADPKIWQKFYRYQDIEKNWPLFIVEEKINLHSTMVREILSEYHENNNELLNDLKPLIGLPIAEYIIAKKIY